MSKKMRIITVVLLVCFAVSCYQQLNHTIYASRTVVLGVVSLVGLQVIFVLSVIRMFIAWRQR